MNLGDIDNEVKWNATYLGKHYNIMNFSIHIEVEMENSRICNILHLKILMNLRVKS